MFKFLRKKPFQVIFLQETHSTVKCEKLWKSQWGGQVLYDHGTSNSKGCAVLIKRNLSTQIHKICKSGTGQFLVIDISIEDIRYTICNLYAPNNDDPEFFKHVLELIDRFDNSNLILGGDFNTILSSNDRRGGAKDVVGHPKCVKILKEYMQSRGILDIWRLRNPNKFKYTWSRQNPSPIRERLDYFLVSYDLTHKILIADIDSAFASDHALPHITISTGSYDYGRGYWKLNTNLLLNEAFLEEAKILIEANANEYSDIKLRWEMTKLDIRGLAIKHSTRAKKSECNKLEVLERKQIQIQKQVEESDHTMFADHDKQLSLISKDIEEIYVRMAHKSSFENYVNWLGGGEKGTKYFFGLEKQRSKKNLEFIQIGEQIYDDPEYILAELNKFYARLFKSKDLEVDDLYLNDVSTPVLREDQKMMLEEPLLIEEIHIAIKQMKRDKCPGLDGLPIEFYDVFWDDIKYTLHSLFIKCIEDREFHGSAKQGIISLLEKPGKDQLQIQNWRPLTLLCCDYKIFSKIIANRIQFVIEDLIHRDQTGFIKNRFIAENLMDLNAVMLHVSENNLPVTLTSIDFKKAYDMTEW